MNVLQLEKAQQQKNSLSYVKTRDTSRISSNKKNKPIEKEDHI